jgi:ADP-ribosylglycohydrolase
LPRTLAAALYLRADPQHAIDIAAEVSRTTQQSPVVLDLCRLWAALLTDALSGVDKATLLAFNGPALESLRQRVLKVPVRNLIERKLRRDPDGTGDALTDTRAALCGALAGAHYGIDSLPAEWRRQLAEDAPLRSLARHLLG